MGEEENQEIVVFWKQSKDSISRRYNNPLQILLIGQARWELIIDHLV